MENLKRRNIIMLTLTFFAVFEISEISAAENIRIAIGNSKIKVGEPLVLYVTYNFEKPLIHSKSGKVRPSLRYDNLLLKLEGKTNETSKLIYVPEIYFFLEDTQGLIYKGEVFIWYNPKELNLAFDSEGSYLISLLANEKLESNVLSIDVIAPLAEEKKAVSMLSNPDDFVFLLHGVCEREQKTERIAKLEQVIKQCEGTTLAKWSAGRLGLEYFKEFHKKNPSFVKFRYKKVKENLKDSLFDQADLYLNKAITLPDEFPIRAEVLDRLVTIEYIKGNYEKVNSLIDEAALKYPHSKLGKGNQEAKEELKRVKEKEEQEKNKTAEPNIKTTG
jgi:hypothetical protein